MSGLRRKKKQGNHDLDLTTFLNLMVVLVSFLLVTAVFSRISIQELKLPTAAAGGATPDKPLLTIEVILRKAGLEVGDGKVVVWSAARNGSKYEVEKLSEYLAGLKEQFKDKTDATLLVEADIPYEDVIQVMDAVKMQRVKVEGQDSVEKKILFPDVSMGDAP